MKPHANPPHAAMRATLVTRARLAFVAALMKVFLEARDLGLGYVETPEYQHLAALVREAEDRQVEYRALKRSVPPRPAMADAPAVHSLVEEAHSCAGDKHRCFLPAKHRYDGVYYCGIHCPLSEQEDDALRRGGR